MPRRKPAAATTSAEAETTTVEFRHHWRDRRTDPAVDRTPGEKVELPSELARRLVAGSIAVYPER